MEVKILSASQIGYSDLGVWFFPKMMVHRQLTVVRCVMKNALYIYNPGLLFIAVIFPIALLFIIIRGIFPIMITLFFALIDIVLSCVMCLLLTIAITLDSMSNEFQMVWKARLNKGRDKKMLISCRNCLSFPIGQFGWYTQGSFLLFWDTVFNQLANLLINYK